MSLLMSLLKNDPAALYKKDIFQLVAMCGDGKLTDGSECSAELREYLPALPRVNICLRMLTTCLAEKFEKSEQEDVYFRMS